MADLPLGRSENEQNSDERTPLAIGADPRTPADPTEPTEPEPTEPEPTEPEPTEPEPTEPEPKKPEPTEPEPTCIEATRIWKLRCLVLCLVIVVVGFVTALTEGTVHHEMLEERKIQPNKSSWPWYEYWWVCWSIKCFVLSLAIFVLFFYLIVEVMTPDEIPKACFSIFPAKQGTRHLLGPLQRFQELPEKKAYYPTKMVLLIFFIFAILGVICAIFETIRDLIDLINFSEILAVSLRCALLVLFIILQAYFFWKNNRFCLNGKLGKAWMAMSIVLAANLSLWFSYVSHEMSEIVAANKTHRTNSTLKQISSVVAEIMFPFLIEFFLMSAILAGSFLANAGRLASVLRRLHRSKGCLTIEAIREKVSIPRAENKRPSLRKNLCSLILGLALVVSAIAISLPIKLFAGGKESWHLALIYLLAALFSIGSVCCVMLLVAFRSTPEEASDGKKARTKADRLILWCCVVAVATNDANRFWGVFNSDKKLANAIGTGSVTLLDICQSVLQVYVLECIVHQSFDLSDVLVCRSKKWGTKLLNILMVVNALEWLVSAVAFSLFFFDSSSELSTASMALLVICAPLQVFFRFHSVSCIHEFSKHSSDNNRQDDEPPPSRLPIDFTITGPNGRICESGCCCCCGCAGRERQMM